MLVNDNILYLAGYILGIVLIHLWLGWVAAVMIIAVSSGWFWRFKTGLWTALIGFILTGLEILRMYWVATDSISKMNELSTEVLAQYPDHTLLVVSLLLPVIFYYLAGVFSCHVYEIIRKIWF